MKMARVYDKQASNWFATHRQFEVKNINEIVNRLQPLAEADIEAALDIMENVEHPNLIAVEKRLIHIGAIPA